LTITIQEVRLQIYSYNLICRFDDDRVRAETRAERDVPSREILVRKLVVTRAQKEDGCGWDAPGEPV